MKKTVLSILALIVFGCTTTSMKNDQGITEGSTSLSEGSRQSIPTVYAQPIPYIKFAQKPRVKLIFPKVNRIGLKEGNSLDTRAIHQFAANIQLRASEKLKSSMDFEITSQPPDKLSIELKRSWLNSIEILDADKFSSSDWESFDSDFLIISSIELFGQEFYGNREIQAEVSLFQISEQKIIFQKKYFEKISHSATVNMLGTQMGEDILEFLTGTRDGSVIPKGTDRRRYYSLSNEYLFSILPSIKKNIGIPESLLTDIQLKLKPRIGKIDVLIKFNSDGSVAEKKIKRSSGNFDYDNIVLQSIEKASPFPKVPARLTEVLYEDGLLIESL